MFPILEQQWLRDPLTAENKNIPADKKKIRISQGFLMEGDKNQLPVKQMVTIRGCGRPAGPGSQIMDS